MKTLLSVVLLSAIAFAAKPTPIKVTIVAPSEDRAFRVHGTGLIGAVQGWKTRNVVFMVNAIIDGEHARLKCAEGRHGCTAIGPGEYDAEVEKDNVWIHQ